mmetsp:Transcript_9454/g.15920  ORF Transcript_9454/g.15920 Transcript_9454/m.15920 type:complete len:112 (+) Transcript_9454:406-741(+)
MPKNLNEENYLKIYKLQQAQVRYHINKVFTAEPRIQAGDREKQEEMNQKLMNVMKQRPKFQQNAMEKYGVKLLPGETKTSDLVMREAYLDFYTKSMQPSNTTGIVYSKRMQ